MKISQLNIHTQEPVRDTQHLTQILKDGIGDMLDCSPSDLSLLFKGKSLQEGSFLVKRHCGAVEHYKATYKVHIDAVLVQLIKKPSN